MPIIYLTGSNGYLGSHIKNYFFGKYKVVSSSSDIRNFIDLRSDIECINPDIIINAAGKTGKPNVDWCESHKEETSSVNISGAINIASIASLLGKYFVHIGSGCIYEGENNLNGYSEDDEPNFYGSFYSRTKIISEKVLKEFPGLQLRIRIPIEGRPNSKNVIDKLLNYEKIISINNSFTVIEDFLIAVEKMINDRKQGIYNMTNVGYCDHEYIMSKYKEIVDPNYNYKIMSISELETLTCAKRSNTILNVNKREKEGYHMPDIKGRIVDIMKEYNKNLKHSNG